MAINKYTTRAIKEAPLAGGLISMPGVRSTNPVVQAQIDAAQKRREEEEREAARMEAERRAAEARQAVGAGLPRASSNAGVRTAVAGLGASAPEVTPTSARLKSTNPTVQAALDRKYAAEDAAYAAWDSQRKARQEAQAEEIKAAGGYYATLPKKEDFAAFSAARGDVNDPTYRYVNDPEGYGREYDLAAEGKSDLAGLRVLNNGERRAYTYLYNKSGKKIADEYLDGVMKTKGAELAEQSSKYQRDFAKMAPVASSVLSPVASTIGGAVSAADLAAQGAKKLVTGEDINYNSRAQQIGRAADDIRGAVSEEIDSPVGRFFYDVGMSAADSLAAGVLGPAAGGAALGLSAGASAARDAASRGASDAQALFQGAAAGIAEAVFEKFSIGEFKALKDVPVTGVKSVIGNVVKQMGINASEEALTEAANIITDRVIMGDMSNYRTSVEAYKAAGMSDGAAKWKAAGDALGQVGLAALSGAVMGGAFGGIGSVQSGIENFAAGDAVRRQGIEQDVLDTGSAQVRGTESRMLADRLKEKQEAGGVLGRTEIGALARETALQEERNRDALGNDLPMFEEAGTAVRASAAALKRAGGVMGREVRFFRDVDDVGGYAENGVVWLNVDARDPMAQVFAHELTHTAENADVYAELRQMALGKMDAGELAAAIEKKKKTYRDFAAKTDRLVRELDDAGAEAELVADYAAGLFSDEAAIGEFAKRNRNAAVRVYDRLREWAASVRGDEEKAALARAQRVYAQALRKTSGDAEKRKNYLSPNFKEQFEEWYTGTSDRKTAKRFYVGTTSNVLKSIGVPDYPIYFHSKKIERIMKDHPGMTADIIEQVPEIIENPLLVMKSKTSESRLTIFGELMDMDGKPVLAILEVSPTNRYNEIQDFGVIASAYGKKNATNFIDSSEIIYQDKNRANNLEQIRLQLPSLSVDRGPGNSITDNRENVKRENDRKYSISEKRDAKYVGDGMSMHDEAEELFERSTYPAMTADEVDALFAEDSEREEQRKAEARERYRAGNEQSLLDEFERRENVIADEWSVAEEDEESMAERDAVLEELARQREDDERGREARLDEYEAFLDDIEQEAIRNWQEMQDSTSTAGDPREIMREYQALENLDAAMRGKDKLAFADLGNVRADGITRDMLNSRANEHFERVVRRGSDNLGYALGKVYWADRAKFDEAANRLVLQYLWNGKYSNNPKAAAKRTNDAFDALWYASEAANREYFEKYKPIRNALQEYLKFDSAETEAAYREQMAKKYGDIMRFSEAGQGISEAYAVLMEQAPELFPEYKHTPKAQLRQMIKIASSFERLKNRSARLADDRAYAEELRRAKADFINSINDTLREAELVRRYAEDKRSRAKEEAEVPTDPMDLVEISAKVRDLKREANRLADRYLFTEDDKAVIDRLLRGELKRNEVVSPNKVGILAVFDKLAEAEAANQVIKKYNARRRAQLDDMADESLGNLEKTKDKAAGLQYSMNTMERNVEDVFKDKGAAKAVRQNFFDVVHRATAAMTRAQNAFNKRVEALKISQKAEKGNRDSEAYVVQLMGEAQDSLAQYKKKERDGMEPEQINGKTKADWEGVIADIKMSNPNMDWAKIDGAVGEFRKIYDELFEQMNLTRVANGYPPIDYRRGYFPHFQKNEPDTVFGKLLAGLGVQAEVTPLPTSINGITDRFKPGISWFGHAQARTGFATDYDAIEGYQQYVRGALRVIYQTENIQRLRALERRIRYATTDEGMKERIKAKQAELDANDALSEDEKVKQMDDLYEEGRFTLSNFCNELSEYTNILAGKRSRLDRGMEALIGRNAYNALKTLNNRLGANMVSANIGSAMTNFIPLQQGYAQLGARRLMSGMWDTVRAIGKNDGFAVQSDFLTNRRGSTTVGNKTMDKVSKTLGWMMETVDNLTSETLVRARYAQNEAAGLSQTTALEEANRWAAKVMGDRSMGAMPTIFHATNPVVKVFTQFQLEVANNVGYIFKDLPKDAAEKGKGELAKLLLKYALSAWLFNELYEFFFGRRPSLDPIGWINEARGDLTGYELPNLIELGVDAIGRDLDAEDFRTKREGIYPAAANLFKNVAEQMPFVGGILPMFVEDVDGRLPISSAMPNLPNIAKAFDKERSQKDRIETLYKELAKPVFYLGMPMGGGQLKKTFEGIVAVAQGGSYTYNTQGEKVLQYPITAETGVGKAWNYAQAGAFGKSSFKTARDWVDSGFDSFSAKETAIYRGLLDVGVSGKEAFEAMKQLGDIQKTDEQTAAELKRQALRDMTLSDEAKAVIYYGMLATEKEQALLDAFAAENFRTARAAMLLNDMRDAKTTAEERKLLADARGLGDVEKVMIYREKISTAWDDEIAAMHEAGFMFDDFLAAQNMLAELDEKNETKRERDNAFIDWAIGQGYELNSRFVMMDCFGVSTEAKKDNQKRKIGITLPTMPEIKLPEIKMPSLPQINLPGFGG